MPSLWQLPQGFVSPYALLDAIYYRKNGRWQSEGAAERLTDLAEQYGAKAVAVLSCVPAHLDAYEARERFKFIADELRLAEIRGRWRPSEELDQTENLAILTMSWANEAEQQHLGDLAVLAGLCAFFAHHAAEPAIEDVRIGQYDSGAAVLIRFATSARAIRDRIADPWYAQLRPGGRRVLMFGDHWAKRHVARIAHTAEPNEAA